MVGESEHLRKEMPLRGESTIVAQQEGTAPEKRTEHQEDTEIVREMSQSMIPFEQVQHRQDIIPVVSIGFFSGDTADEHEVERPRIVDVWGNVHQALCCPPQGHRSAERITRLDQEGAETDHRHENLAERSTQNRHEAAEWDKDHMSRFMKGQIDQVEE